VRDGDDQAFRAFADTLVEGLAQRLASDPAPMRSFVQVMVLEKRR
jgi:hypothetical protein